MSSRDKILARVKANKPPQAQLPPPVAFAALPANELPTRLTESMESAGSVVLQVPDLASIGVYLREHFSPEERVLNTVNGVGYGKEAAGPITDGRVLGNLEVAVVEGELAVAENGAVWVIEDRLPTRVLPFICEHLVLVVKQDTIVGTMHQAYDKIKIDSTGYGTFIAGPSRTADIEQSLVIGAHGPKRTHVFIVEK